MYKPSWLTANYDFFFWVFSCRNDVIVALSFGLLFCLLIISSYLTLHYRYFKVSAVIIFHGILLPVCLNVSRKRKLAKKRERRMLLPLSMWILLGENHIYELGPKSGGRWWFREPTFHLGVQFNICCSLHIRRLFGNYMVWIIFLSNLYKLCTL